MSATTTKGAQTMAQRFAAFVNSETGPKTTHFWGPVANWGFVLAGLSDTFQKKPEAISANMTSALCVYSGLFMWFAWAVKPRNYLLFACHFCNEGVQLNQMRRVLTWQYSQKSSQSAPAAAS